MKIETKVCPQKQQQHNREATSSRSPPCYWRRRRGLATDLHRYALQDIYCRGVLFCFSYWMHVTQMRTTSSSSSPSPSSLQQPQQQQYPTAITTIPSHNRTAEEEEEITPQQQDAEEEEQIESNRKTPSYTSSATAASTTTTTQKTKNPPLLPPMLARKVCLALQEDILSLQDDAVRGYLPEFTSFCVDEESNLGFIVQRLRKECPNMCKDKEELMQLIMGKI